MINQDHHIFQKTHHTLTKSLNSDFRHLPFQFSKRSSLSLSRFGRMVPWSELIHPQVTQIFEILQEDQKNNQIMKKKKIYSSYLVCRELRRMRQCSSREMPPQFTYGQYYNMGHRNSLGRKSASSLGHKMSLQTIESEPKKEPVPLESSYDRQLIKLQLEERKYLLQVFYQQAQSQSRKK